MYNTPNKYSKKCDYCKKVVRPRDNTQRKRGGRIRIKCVFCGEWINNPKIGRMLCGKKECKREYNKENKNMYRKDPKTKKRLKAYMREYSQRPEVRERNNPKKRIYHRALYKLKDNHKKEFKKIHKKLQKMENETNKTNRT